MAKQQRVVWFRFKDGAYGEWSVVLVKRTGKEGHRGLTVPDKRQILIEYSNDYTLMCRTFVHELLHVAGKETKKSDDDDDPLNNMLFYAEEVFVRGAENALHSCLVSLGFKFPEIPDEASLLAA